jgi:hypothetical protein
MIGNTGAKSVTKNIIKLLKCPECDLTAKISATEEQITDDKAICKHRQDPLNCPSLRPALTAALQAIFQR